jgi:hypothetical protein
MIAIKLALFYFHYNQGFKTSELKKNWTNEIEIIGLVSLFLKTVLSTL